MLTVVSGELDCETLSPFTIPKKNSESICSFFKLHPIQPKTCQLSYLFTRLCGDKVIPRNWLSFNVDNGEFYCYACMVFSDVASTFRTGAKLNLKHASTRVKEHEISESHILAAQAYVRYDRSKTIEELIHRDQNLLRLSQVHNNQQLVKRLINWILCIGRQGIAYRGNAESTKYLNDRTVNHGNLLEILLTASQQDELLKVHLETCGKLSIGEDPDKKGPKGRGSRLTFLSKTSVNKLIEEIGGSMKKKICDGVISSGMYSIMVDSTPDIVGHEQCSIVVRFINGTTFEVEEKLIGLLRLTNTSGEGYADEIVSYLRKLGLNPLLIIACSFDGASNMRSDEKGLQAKLKEINEDLIYTWCYSHNLNLSVSESVSCVLSAKTLFGLLQATYTFCSASYKRVFEWEKCTMELKGRKKLIRFENFGKTRWFSNEKSLYKIFGTYAETSFDVYLAMLKFLYNVKTGKSFEAKATFEASALLHNWTKLETILTAFTFLKIFGVLGPVSRYLQTAGLDMMAALSMIKRAISDIGDIRNSFEEIKQKSISFAESVNENIILEMRREQVIVNEELCDHRVRKIRRLPGEVAEDEPVENVWENYRVTQFLVICDTVSQTLNNRFNSDVNKELTQDMSFFHPNKFDDVLKQKDLKLPFLAKVLKIENSVLVEELNHFAKNFAKLSKTNEEVQTSKEGLQQVSPVLFHSVM